MPWNFSTAIAIGGRDEQQDRVAVLHADDGESHLLLVADGMGGHEDGARAAQLVLDCAKRSFSEQSGQDPQGYLDRLCGEAHRCIRMLAPGRERAPGSTCAVLYLRPGEAYWGHVGDSRIYHWRDGSLLHRTRDHTAIELARETVGSLVGAAQSMGERLYMCLGGRNRLQPELGLSDVQPGDLFLLCSDGFWKYLDAERLGQELNAGIHPDTATGLVAEANRRGGGKGDNISLAIAYWDGYQPLGRLARIVRWFGL